MKAEADDVAEWMHQRVFVKGSLEHATAVEYIKRNFGKEFVYTNENGNEAIDRKVLRLFEKRTRNYVVWDGQLWRKRHSSDKPGRQQD